MELLVVDLLDSLSLGIDNGGLLVLVLAAYDFSSSENRGVWVQLVKEGKVLKRVSLSVEASWSSLGVTDSGLNFIRVDDSGDIRVSNRGLREQVSRLLARSLLVGSEDGVESLESILGPDEESSEVTSRSQLQ